MAGRAVLSHQEPSVEAFLFLSPFSSSRKEAVMGPAIMIAVSLMLFTVLKAITLIEYRRNCSKPTLREAILWFCGWPGLNARDFFMRVPQGVKPPELREWLTAIAKLAFGASLLVITPRVISAQPLLGGWVGMVGIVFCMHFGGFHLLALAWRLAGRNVHPIMKAPICAQSLSEFWSQRWNLAFRDFASLFILRPLARGYGVPAAAFACFVFSGVVHDLAISVPAGAGFGLPTAYFLFQGIAAAFERSRWGARLGLKGGWRGRVFALACTAGPAFWLFHPAFVLNVIVPLFV
jgi:hypothetical protein